LAKRLATRRRAPVGVQHEPGQDGQPVRDGDLSRPLEIDARDIWPDHRQPCQRYDEQHSQEKNEQQSPPAKLIRLRTIRYFQHATVPSLTEQKGNINQLPKT
jgi:hypothetical protein